MRDLLAKLLPEIMMEQVEKESRNWYFKCSCGHEFDVWSIGGVRYKGAGRPRQLVTCPKCARIDFLKLNKRE